ncbi:hypothetical protein SAMN06265375_10323 [Muriicola jejuensis]|uniref:Uncharacterized protein n=1 Tax=Muriicola jejuensis TaxID=504488 RepID=A0A6P0UF19_9FLAO|nr:hypothetical protein [Muriicola jejuensis]NER11607.1 hypothetical protein [Muriicola jejuensis]SMP19311.1 hypothetical protein SAMN06265375_10323 [Muriicola jejuensis]
MELITLGIGLVVNTFVKNKEVNAAVDDFVSDSVRWVRGWFKKGDHKELVNKLETAPESKEVNEELVKAMGDLSGNEKFMKELERWIRESQKPNPSMKNVLKDVDVKAGGNIKIGDKTVSDQKFDMKNVIERGKFEAGGDFTLGDG